MQRHFKDNKVAIIGLGYVGLPLFLLSHKKGYKTIGFARNEKKLAMIRRRISPLYDKRINEGLKKLRGKLDVTSDFSRLSEADIILVCVPTPVLENHKPDLGPIRSASMACAKILKKGQLIVVESTINPGVCEEVVLPILEKSGFTGGKDFYLAHCPERINPGDPRWYVGNIPRVVGALSEKGVKMASRFYRSILSAKVTEMSTIKEAEATKIVENTFRDINIAYVNELAKSFDVLGIDIKNVLEGSKTKPFAFMAHYPSVGVGGHCISVDPYYLIERAKKSGFDHKFLRLARSINNSMPGFAVRLLEEELQKVGKKFRGAKVGVLGLSYKANVDDMRESPAIEVITILKRKRAKVYVFDPYFLKESLVNTRSLPEILRKSDYIILAASHNEFTRLQAKDFKKYGIKIIVDGKNCFNKEDFQSCGIVYKGIGR